MGALRFVLNDDDVVLDQVGARDMLLDFLRLDRRLTGTKEGCAEGDCGACTVLVGRITGAGLVYEPVNACIRLLASCHGCHIVTVEHLRGAGGGLHPVQQALVDHHGSQCGFCTPGFVMALYAWWLSGAGGGETGVETALQGNLCRCTGYAPIIRAALTVAAACGQDADALAKGRESMAARLAAIPRGRVDVSRGDDRAIIPADTDDLAALLLDHPQATIVAGATDVGLWVTKFLRDISPAILIGHLLKDIEVGPDSPEIRLGAGVTYAEALPLILRDFPMLRDYWLRIGGAQVRAMGTIGGNIANGSPIGDTPPLLMALGAQIVLRRGDMRRRVAVTDFFIDYGQQDRAPGEFVEQIIIPRPGPDARLAAYKVSKRSHSDITSVAAGFRVDVQDGVVTDAVLAFGGMAGVPKRAAAAEAALRGQPFAEAAFLAAAAAIAGDFTPMTDMRASAAYRAQVAANLIRRFWLEQSGQAMPPVRLEEVLP
ncbi:MAG: xanthine dehydrogenase small subunit [Paracoccus sp. (in: a-proteobacteria)]|uniref:xanthine dehydrogenase small subunit n=1 Tax=Paracoccus sp. TaxID=267 RepID=UPI0026E08910|nr:xanthine dehydrogenase small subunit [Paracoccus sp. (in: a-proteobacteria)]MDO5631715.1 xanthine dehydrogenase small subunit [Paracoccus sp. (in: a-proteobacteria)]